jgi:hypothetical protein
MPDHRSRLLPMRPLLLRSILILFLGVFVLGPAGIVSAQQVPTSRIVRSVVERALRNMGNPGLEVVAQGSWISGKNYRDPRFQQVLEEASDHDMRIVFRSKDIAETEAMETWRRFRMGVQEELQGLVNRGIVTSDEVQVIRRSINIYPPEELMRGIETSEEALARFGRWGVYPSLLEAGKEGSGGSYGSLLKFERQGYENTERAVTLYLDKGVVRTGSADLVHMLEEHGMRTPEALGKAAEGNLADALKSLKQKNLKDTAKYMRRAAKYLKEAKGKLRANLTPNDQALLDLEQKLNDMLTKFEGAETRSAILSDKVLAKSAEGAALQQQILDEFSKMSDDVGKVLAEAADDSLLVQKLGQSVAEKKPLVSRLFRGILEGADQWLKVRPQVRAGLSRFGQAAEKIGFLNALAAYWTIKDLPEVYVKEGAEKAAAKFSMSLASLAVPEVALGELVAVLATTIAEVAVDYVSAYGYKAVTSTQDCFDLIAGLYTVYGREAQVLGEGIKKCHQVNDIRQLACDVYDRDDLRGTLQRTSKLDPKAIPSELNSTIACHAENASKRFDEENKADKGVEEALVAKCTGPIVAAWIQERDLAIEEVQMLLSDLERSELRVSYDVNAATLKSDSKQVTVGVSAEIVPAMGDLLDKIQEKIACPGGRGCKPFIYQNVTWKLGGSKVGSGTSLSSDFTFDKVGVQSVCAEWELEYGVFNTPSTLPPSGLSGKIQRTGCVDINVADELGPDKITVQITGPNKTKPPEKGETGRQLSLSVDLKSKRDPKEFQYVWTVEGGYAGSTSQDDRFQTVTYQQPGTYTVKVEVYDRADQWKVQEIKRVKLAEASHKLTIEPSVKDAKIEMKITGPSEVEVGAPINLSVEVLTDATTKAKLKPPIWFFSSGNRVAVSAEEDPEDQGQWQQSLGQGYTASYTPREAGGYDFHARISGSSAYASQRVFVNCKDSTGTSTCRLEGTPPPEKLGILVTPELTNLTSGEKITIEAVATGGTPPYRFTWTGDVQGTGASVGFIASQKNRTVAVEAKDAKGQTAKGTVTFSVDKIAIPIEGLKDKVPFGTRLDVRVAVEPGQSVLWQSSPTLTFKDLESTDGKTWVTFDQVDRVKIWADIRVKKGEVSETVDSTDQVEVTVTAPDATIEFDPPAQTPGKEVTAEVKATPELDSSLVRFVWLAPSTSNREEIAPGKIRFKVVDRQAVPVELEVRAVRSDDTLASLKRSFDPAGNSAATEVKAGDDGKARSKKQAAAAKLTQAKEAVAAGKLDDGIQLATEAGTLDPTNAEAGDLVKKWTAEKATVAKQIDKTNQLVAASKFDEATKELAVASALHPKYPPVVDTGKQLAERKSVYTRTVLAAREKFTKAKEAAAQGNLPEALAIANEAAKLDPASGEAAAYAARLKSEQTLVTDKAQRSRTLADQEHFAEAEALLAEAKQLHPKYQPVLDAETFVKTRKAAYEKMTAESKAQLDKAKSEVHLGKLDEAIASASQAVKINPKNTEAAKYIAFVQAEKESTNKALDEVKRLIGEAHFPEAQNAFIAVKNKYSYYPPVWAVESALSSAWSEWQGKARDAVGAVRMSNERREFAQSLVLAQKAREAKLDSFWSEQLRQQEDWAKRWETEKEQNRKVLKSGEEKLKQYDYAGALKAFEDGFQNFNNFWAMSDPEPNYYNALRGEAFTKQKRLTELVPVIRRAAEDTSWAMPTDVLEAAIKNADEAITLQPNNSEIRKYRDLIVARLGKTTQDNTRLAEGRKYLDAGRAAESDYSTQESYLKANPNMWGEQIEERMEGLLQTAADNYTASLRFIPDPTLEKRIPDILATLEGRKKYLGNYRQSRTLLGEADQAAREARSDPSFEISQGKFVTAMDKYRQSLQLYRPFNAENLEKTVYVLDLEMHDRAAKKYWADGQALEQATRILDALAAYDKAVAALHPTVGAQGANWMTVHIGELRNRVTGAKQWRDQGETQQKAGRIAEAVASYRQSLKLIPDQALEGHVRLLEASLASANQQAAAAGRLWQEGMTFFNQGRFADALAKFKESLQLAPDPQRAQYVKDLEARKAKAQALRDDGYRLQTQSRIPEAVGKYKESLAAWPDAELEKYIRQVEASRPPAPATPQPPVATAAPPPPQPSQPPVATATPQPPKPPVVSPVGQWTGSWKSENRADGDVFFWLTQNGSRVTGTYKIDVMLPAVSGKEKERYTQTGSIDGTLAGGRLTGSFKASDDTINSGTIECTMLPDGNSISVTVRSQSTSESWTARRVGAGTAAQPAAPAPAASSGAVTAEITNRSRANAHIFLDGETFGSGNRFAPGESRRIKVALSRDGKVTFKAGRDGQVLATKTWAGDPAAPNRVPVVIFDDTNPYEKLVITTGLR